MKFYKKNKPYQGFAVCYKELKCQTPEQPDRHTLLYQYLNAFATAGPVKSLFPL